MATKRKVNRRDNRQYSIRGAITRLKIKRNGGHSEKGGGAGKSWYEMLHCRYPAPVYPMCYKEHVQHKVEAPHK